MRVVSALRSLRPPVQNMLPGRFTTSLVLSLLSMTAVGCGDSSDTVSVIGTVTYRGESFPRGAVTFFPAAGRPMTAAISDEGEYSAELAPGDYTVVVNVSTELPPGYQEGDPLPPPKIVLPPEYTTRVRSTLSATVTEDLDEPLDFALQ